MKRLIRFLSLAVCAVTLCLCSSCGMSGKVETVYLGSITGGGTELGTIYRHNVKEVQLLNSSTEAVLETSKDFKYYYSSKDFIYNYEYTGNNQKVFEYYFPSASDTADFNENYSEKHECYTKIKIVISGVGAEYRPSVKIKNNIATVEYYEFEALEKGNSYVSFTTALNGYYAYKNEIDYNKYDSIYKTEFKKYSEVKNDSDKLDEFYSEVNRKYGTTACVHKKKQDVTLGGLITIMIEYHD